MKLKWFCQALLASSAISLCHSAELSASEESRFTLVGYGDVKYEQSKNADSSAFTARFVPIFLFQLNDRMHVEAEVEISADENGGSEQELEYANLHYFVTDTTTITAGKFLLPFGRFGSQFHPSWINRLPFTPGIYGTHGADASAMVPLLPVLSDTGLAVKQVVVFDDDQKMLFDLFFTNGPRLESEEENGPMTDGEMPELAFEPANRDNNRDKAVGGRLAYAWLPAIELGASWYRSAYDDDERLNFDAQGFDLNIVSRYAILRGEYLRTETDAAMADGVEALKRSGWYLQATLKIGDWWPHLGATELVIERAEVTPIDASSRWAYGINYWFDARSVVKFAYDVTDVETGGTDRRMVAQLSFGF